ncbi:hypothetical protein DPMN_056664 [Dreissena polymorpha]|uniref:Circadian locomoter output cycles protein kaput n=1 Tax=Dreissena polymorpha TaxID=45954 RepID=A0A9D4CUU2_DREPO|nr:hypothetical protein DPMN_056664 [Dreissena polymorpha]
MSFAKRISYGRSATVTDSDSAIADDDDDLRGGRRSSLSGKDKLNRNLSEKKRRDQFNMLVNELSTMVSTTNKKMDKSTVLKSTISFLKDHQETANQAQVHEIKENWKPSFLTNDEFMHLMLEALDSFLLVFTQQGLVLYASEGVTSLLGHLPSDLINQSIYEFIDKSETGSVHNILYNQRVSPANDSFDRDGSPICFECNLLRGMIDPRRTPQQYEKVLMRGNCRYMTAGTVMDDLVDLPIAFKPGQVYFLCTVRLQSTQLVREMSIVDSNKEFSSRHSLEWKFLFLDHRAPPIIGYLPFEVLGTSGYDYYHPDDLDGVTISHEQLMKTGEGTSCYYRFLTKGQQWIWLKSRYFITYHQWNSKPEFINCTNTVVSYASVRAQKRKDLGCDDATASHEPVAKMQLMSPSSACSINVPDSNACNVSDDGSVEKGPQQPTSTSHQRSHTVSQQLQKFLHRHIQQQQLKQQQQQQQDSVGKSISSQATQAMSATSTTFSSQHLQRFLYNKPTLRAGESQHARILSRPNISTATAQCMVPSVSSTPTMLTVLSSPATDVSPMPSQLDMLPSNVYMTPVQKQLHEQLQRKASQVQSLIFRQQEELKKIHQQLLFTQVPQVPTAFNTPPSLTPNYNSDSTDSLVGMLGMDSQDAQSVQSQSPNSPQQGANNQSMSIAAMHNVSVNQSQILSFSMLPNDTDFYLSIANNSADHLSNNQ